ncbi:MAG: hypothetical protein QSU88_02905, partial [Candidatus Methanoperedens sp.]|nr:hypothetical protein [Candidatus Methanoperedens sp.]
RKCAGVRSSSLLQEVVMGIEERRLECPGCGELMPALLLNDLNRCDNCGCPAHMFDQVKGKITLLSSSPEDGAIPF